MLSSNVRLCHAATVGAAAFLSPQIAETAVIQPTTHFAGRATQDRISRIDVVFGYTSGHLSTVFSQPVLRQAPARALTQREDAVFRRALLNSVRIVSAGRLVTR
jgi:hypothetical protein